MKEAIYRREWDSDRKQKSQKGLGQDMKQFGICGKMVPFLFELYPDRP